MAPIEWTRRYNHHGDEAKKAFKAAKGMREQMLKLSKQVNHNRGKSHSLQATLDQQVESLTADLRQRRDEMHHYSYLLSKINPQNPQGQSLQRQHRHKMASLAAHQRVDEERLAKMKRKKAEDHQKWVKYDRAKKQELDALGQKMRRAVHAVQYQIHQAEIVRVRAATTHGERKVASRWEAELPGRAQECLHGPSDSQGNPLWWYDPISIAA